MSMRNMKLPVNVCDLLSEMGLVAKRPTKIQCLNYHWFMHFDFAFIDLMQTNFHFDRCKIDCAVVHEYTTLKSLNVCVSLCVCEGSIRNAFGFIDKWSLWFHLNISMEHSIQSHHQCECNGATNRIHIYRLVSSIHKVVIISRTWVFCIRALAHTHTHARRMR